LSVPEISARIRRALEELKSPDGLVLFTDIPGGTPSNLSFPLLKDSPGVEMVTGFNLYMLISSFNNRERLPLSGLVEKALADGQKSIKDIRQMFAAKVR
jgi:mannose/fructose-specific phosphotransferase system component IIA